MRHGVQSLWESWCRAECAPGRTQDERGSPKAMAVASFCAPDIGRTPFRVSREMASSGSSPLGRLTKCRARYRPSRSSTDGYSWAHRCRPEPIKAVANTLKDHWLGFLNVFDSRLTNGHVEAVNSLIPGRQGQGLWLRDHQAPDVLYLVAGKLTRLPTSPRRQVGASHHDLSQIAMTRYPHQAHESRDLPLLPV